jgi:hypothetical protein
MGLRSLVGGSSAAEGFTLFANTVRGRAGLIDRRHALRLRTGPRMLPVPLISECKGKNAQKFGVIYQKKLRLGQLTFSPY